MGDTGRNIPPAMLNDLSHRFGSYSHDAESYHLQPFAQAQSLGSAATTQSACELKPRQNPTATTNLPSHSSDYSHDAESLDYHPWQPSQTQSLGSAAAAQSAYGYIPRQDPNATTNLSSHSPGSYSHDAGSLDYHPQPSETQSLSSAAAAQSAYGFIPQPQDLELLTATNLSAHSYSDDVAGSSYSNPEISHTLTLDSASAAAAWSAYEFIAQQDLEAFTATNLTSNSSSSYSQDVAGSSESYHPLQTLTLPDSASAAAVSWDNAFGLMPPRQDPPEALTTTNLSSHLSSYSHDANFYHPAGPPQPTSQTQSLGSTAAALQRAYSGRILRVQQPNPKASNAMWYHEIVELGHRRRRFNRRFPYECRWPECGKRFEKPDTLYLHMRIHNSDIKPFVCEVPTCGKAFSTLTSLKHHTARTRHWKLVGLPDSAEGEAPNLSGKGKDGQ